MSASQTTADATAAEPSHLDKLANQQTALYALISRSDLPKDVYAELLAIHSSLGDVVYDLMTSETEG